METETDKNATTSTPSATQIHSKKSKSEYIPRTEEQKREYHRQRQINHKNHLRSLFSPFSTIDELLDEHMYMIDFESSCHDGQLKKEHVIEIGIVLFTLRQGEISYFHRFIMPEPIHPRLYSQASRVMKLHGIPWVPTNIFPLSLYERNYKQLWSDILEFVNSECPKQSEVIFPPGEKTLLVVDGKVPESKRTKLRENYISANKSSEEASSEETASENAKEYFPLFFAKGSSLENRCLVQISQKAEQPLQDGELKVNECEDLIYESLSRIKQEAEWSGIHHPDVKSCFHSMDETKDSLKCQYHTTLKREMHCALADSRACVKSIREKVLEILNRSTQSTEETNKEEQ